MLWAEKAGMRYEGGRCRPLRRGSGPAPPIRRETGQAANENQRTHTDAEPDARPRRAAAATADEVHSGILPAMRHRLRPEFVGTAVDDITKDQGGLGQL